MTHRFAEIAFTPSVRDAQTEYGFPNLAERFEQHSTRNDVLGQLEKEFIEGRDTLFLATVGETGWPYVQHRGGPKGFVKVLGSGFLAFPDFGGNRQLISTGNASINERCSMIFTDFLNRRRLKVLGFLRSRTFSGFRRDLPANAGCPFSDQKAVSELCAAKGERRPETDRLALNAARLTLSTNLSRGQTHANCWLF